MKLLITVAAASIAFGNQNSKTGIYLAKIVLAFSILYGLAFAALLQYFYDQYSQDIYFYTPWRYSLIEALGFSALATFVSGFLVWALLRGMKRQRSPDSSRVRPVSNVGVHFPANARSLAFHPRDAALLRFHQSHRVR